MLRFVIEASEEDRAQLPTLRQLQGFLENEAMNPPPASASPILPTPTATTDTVATSPSSTVAPTPTPTTWSGAGPARSRDDGYVMPALPPPPPPPGTQSKRPSEHAQSHIIIECQFEAESERNKVDLDKYSAAVASSATSGASGLAKTTVEFVPVARSALAGSSSPSASSADAVSRLTAPSPSAPQEKAQSMLDFMTRHCGEPAASFPTLRRLATMLTEDTEGEPSKPVPAPASATREAEPLPCPSTTSTAPQPTTSHPSAASASSAHHAASGMVPLPIAIPLPVLPGQSQWGGLFVAATPPPELPFDGFYSAAVHATKSDTQAETSMPRTTDAAQPVPLPPPAAPASARRAEAHPRHTDDATALRVEGAEVRTSARGRPSRPASSSTPDRKDVWRIPHHAAVAGRAPAPPSAGEPPAPRVSSAALVMESRGLTRRHKTPYAERFMRALYYRSATPHAEAQRNSQSRQLVVQRLYSQLQTAEQLQGAASGESLQSGVTRAANGCGSRVVSRLERDVQRAACYGVEMTSTPTSAAMYDAVNTSLDAPSTASSGVRGSRTGLPRPPPSHPPSSRTRGGTRPLSARPGVVAHQVSTTNTVTTATTTTTHTVQTTTTTVLPRAARGGSAASSANRMRRTGVAARRGSSRAAGLPDLAIVGEHVPLPTERCVSRMRPRFQS